MARTRAPHLVDVPFVAAGSGHGPLFSYPLRILGLGVGAYPFSQLPFLMHPFVRCLGFSCNRFASSGLEMLEGCVAKLDTRAALSRGCMCNDQITTRGYNDRGAFWLKTPDSLREKLRLVGGMVVFMRATGE